MTVPLCAVIPKTESGSSLSHYTFHVIQELCVVSALVLITANLSNLFHLEELLEAVLFPFLLYFLGTRRHASGVIVV